MSVNRFMLLFFLGVILLLMVGFSFKEGYKEGESANKSMISHVGDTVITKQQLVDYEQCAENLKEKGYIIFTMKQAIEAKDRDINSLKADLSKLKYKVKEHNSKLKNNQSKYWITIKTN